MRILFDSKKPYHKEPFGCLTPEQPCRLRLLIPKTVGTTAVSCLFQQEDGTAAMTVAMTFAREDDRGYDAWEGNFSLAVPGLFFYYFQITGNTGTFRLFRQGRDTNMEAGDLWQVSCIPEDFTTPDWAKGAVIYQIFPDRFHKSGQCDLTGKLTPYTVHESWDEEVAWQPNERGEILNNDFYGGNFRGITEKMGYIASFGTTILYLNPIGKSFSNHRYDTGDYKTPDPMLGTPEDFQEMCREAHLWGIRVVLDGVFSHTGDNSLYFDRFGKFGGKGAYRDEASPYRSWYSFGADREDYNSWWGFKNLPTVNKMDPGFVDYIIDAPDSVVAHWLSLGADGFRLDVADELPDAFILRLKQRIRSIRPDALLIGEVWEDASNKIAYDIRRRYFVDGELDSIMNYPFRKAILELLYFRDPYRFEDQILEIAENYPPQVLHCNMNLLSSHDTPRILTALADPYEGSREEMARRTLSPQARKEAQARFIFAAVLQFTLPGSPSIYYGDEVGMEGGKDPFNRRTFPWGKKPEFADLLRQLGALKREHEALRVGDIQFHTTHRGILHFSRSTENQRLHIYLNGRSGDFPIKQRCLAAGGVNPFPIEGNFLREHSWCITQEVL